MARIYKVVDDPLPVASHDASENETLGAPAEPQYSEAESCYEFDQGHRTTHRTVSEPSTSSCISAASSTWSASSPHSVSKLSADPSAPPARSRLTVVRRRRGKEPKRTTGEVLAAIKNEKTMVTQKDEAMRDVQRVVAEPLSHDPSPDGRPPSESEMRDDLDEREAPQLPIITQVSPTFGDGFEVSMTPVQSLPQGSSFSDFSTMEGALPHYALDFSSHNIYDFNEMNEALPGQTPHLSSRRSFTPYELTSGSRTQTKVRRIREDGRHQRKS